MNSVQVHLALTHVPVILSLVGLIMLVIALFMKNIALSKISYVVLLIAGIAVIPVYFTGEGAEEAVEKMPGVSDAVIEKHEDVAKLAMMSISVAGLLALAALVSLKFQVVTRIFKVGVFLTAITSGVLMIQTAHLGGQIRHTEIRSGTVVSDGKEEQDEEQPQEKENTTTSIQLNNGNKWKADQATKTNVAAMVQVVTDNNHIAAPDGRILFKGLQTKIDTLVKQCRMEGPDHDALHLWLKKVMKGMKELKEEDDEYSKVYATLKDDIESFYVYFE